VQNFYEDDSSKFNESKRTRYVEYWTSSEKCFYIHLCILLKLKFLRIHVEKEFILKIQVTCRALDLFLWKKICANSREEKTGGMSCLTIVLLILGYANAKIYECENPKCPRPGRFISGGSSKDDSFPCMRPVCSGRFQLVRHVSFVDCPGHDILMATMLNGAAVMDAALLLIGKRYIFWCWYEICLLRHFWK